MEPRSSPQTSRFRLDRERYQLVDGSTPVRLEKQPMELLILLAERSGQLVTRDEIAAALWGEGIFVDTGRDGPKRFLGQFQGAFSKPMDTRLMTRSVGREWYMPLVGLMQEDSFSKQCS